MELRRHEIRTGVLVIFTIAITIAVILWLSAPGVVKATKHFYVYFDNVMGLKTGAPVLLAGRKIGDVSELTSPVPESERPQDHENFEVRVKIDVENDAQIFKDVTVEMKQFGVLGDGAIDFVKGTESSGLAPPETTFIGSRIRGPAELPPKVIEMLEPLVNDARTVLKDLKPTTHEFRRTLVEARKTFANLNEVTSKGAPIDNAAQNIEDFTETIKREPWRLIRKSKKEYPEENFRY